MRKMKLFGLVQYLKSVEFVHDTFDLEDKSTEGILGEYGVYDEFADDELRELRIELYKLAEQNEFREASIIAATGSALGVA